MEIAYGIDEPYQNQGFATEPAGALKEYAMSIEKVKTVRAHTKKDNVASERTLAKCGFTYIGVFENPDDGLVNRWEIDTGTKP